MRRVQPNYPPQEKTLSSNRKERPAWLRLLHHHASTTLHHLIVHRRIFILAALL